MAQGIQGSAHVWLVMMKAMRALTRYAAAGVEEIGLGLSDFAVLEVLHQDYVRTARAKGLNETGVLIRHALKNAAIPILTIVGLQFGTLLGGAVVTETVFAWPGIGRLAIQSISNRDYPVVQAAVLLVAISFVLVNLLVDLAYGWLDPRIRYA